MGKRAPELRRCLETYCNNASMSRFPVSSEGKLKSLTKGSRILLFPRSCHVLISCLLAPVLHNAPSLSLRQHPSSTFVPSSISNSHHSSFLSIPPPSAKHQCSFPPISPSSRLFLPRLLPDFHLPPTTFSIVHSFKCNTLDILQTDAYSHAPAGPRD